jgi:hypothetical protein
MACFNGDITCICAILTDSVSVLSIVSSFVRYYCDAIPREPELGKSVDGRTTFGAAEPATRFSIEDFTRAPVASGRSCGWSASGNLVRPEACLAGWRGKGARGRNRPWLQSLEQ